MAGSRSPDVKALMRELQEFGFTQRDVAAVVGVDERSVRNWTTGRTPPAADDESRLRELHYLTELLSDSLDGKGPAQWMRAPNRLLRERKPLSMLRDGDYERALGAVNAFIDGSYA